MRAAAASSGLSPVGMRAATGKLAQAKSHALGGEVSDDSPPLEALQDHYHMSLEQGKLLALLNGLESGPSRILMFLPVKCGYDER